LEITSEFIQLEYFRSKERILSLLKILNCKST